MRKEQNRRSAKKSRDLKQEIEREREITIARLQRDLEAHRQALAFATIQFKTVCNAYETATSKETLTQLLNSVGVTQPDTTKELHKKTDELQKNEAGGENFLVVSAPSSPIKLWPNPASPMKKRVVAGTTESAAEVVVPGPHLKNTRVKRGLCEAFDLATSDSKRQRKSLPVKKTPVKKKHNEQAVYNPFEQPQADNINNDNPPLMQAEKEVQQLKEAQQEAQPEPVDHMMAVEALTLLSTAKNSRVDPTERVDYSFGDIGDIQDLINSSCAKR